MITTKLILSICLLWLGYTEETHPIKISTGELLYHKEKKEFVMKLRFFYDDFVASVNQKLQTRIDPDKMDNNAGLMFDRFVQSYFSLKINNKQATPVYRRASREDQVITVEYVLDASGINYISEIEIYYPVLMDFFKEQQNLFRVDLLKDGNMTTFRFYSDVHRVKKEFNQKMF